MREPSMEPRQSTSLLKKDGKVPSPVTGTHKCQYYVGYRSIQSMLYVITGHDALVVIATYASMPYCKV